MTVNCSECIHDKVCGIKDKFYEIQGMCENADTKYEEFSINFNCKYYSKNEQTVKVPKCMTAER